MSALGFFYLPEVYRRFLTHKQQGLIRVLLKGREGIMEEAGKMETTFMKKSRIMVPITHTEALGPGGFTSEVQSGSRHPLKCVRRLFI